MSLSFKAEGKICPTTGKALSVNAASFQALV